MTFEEFAQLVDEAVEALPNDLVRKLDNVAIVTEAGAPDGPLGEYFGIPRPDRWGDPTGTLPDKIAIYHAAILDCCGEDPVAVAQEIRRTLWHEIGHHLGWDDDVLEGAESRRGWR